MNRAFPQVVYQNESAKLIDRNILVGKRFVFTDTSGLSSETAAKLTSQGQAQSASFNGTRFVLPLAGTEPVNLGELLIHGDTHNLLTLASITCDKMIYRQGKDVVHLFLVANNAVRKEREFVVREESAGVYLRRRIRFNQAGVAELTLRDLPAGNYVVVYDQSHKEKSQCSFVVAEYRLAALVAELQHFQFESESAIRAQIKLTTFGVPVAGNVRCDLTEDNRSLHVQTVEVINGIARVFFPIAGEGSLSINVQLADDPSRTASVILQGTASEDRETTLFSQLGPIVHGSLVPRDDARSIRGIWFSEEGILSQPVHVQPPYDGKLQLEFAADMECLCVQVVCPSALDPAGCVKAINRAEAKAGESIMIDDCAALSMIGIAGFVGGKPWEGWSAVVGPPRLSPRITVPESPQPNTSCEIELEANGAQFAYVIVKDARLPASQSPQSRLASALKSHVLSREEELQPIQPVQARALRSPFSILMMNGTVSHEQLLDASRLARQRDFSLAASLIKLGYATPDEVWRAIATSAGKSIVELDRLDIPESVIELMPESVARENVVIPVMESDGCLYVVTSQPNALDLIEKLRFILNREIEFAVAPRTAIIDAINHTYGQMEGESADSILQEFTDTAIDFRETFSVGMLGTNASERGTNVTKNVLPESGESQGEVIYAGLIPLLDGRAIVNAQLGTGIRDYTVDAFFISNEGGFDWVDGSERFRSEQNPFIELDLPQFIHRLDGATGRVYVGANAGKVRVQLLCDGQPVELANEDNRVEPESILSITDGQLCLTFLATAGQYVANVEDVESGETANCAKAVDAPGELQRVSRPLVVLNSGEKISMEDDAGISSISIIRNLSRPFDDMVYATCNYEHLCCEQTAAKVRAAVAMYMTCTADDITRLTAAESAINAGVSRMMEMWIGGNGFKSYPESPAVPNVYWGLLAAKHLLYLKWIEEAENSSAELSRNARRGLMMADDVCNASNVNSNGNEFKSPADAYAALRFSENADSAEKAIDWARENVATVDSLTDKPRRFLSSVTRRTEQAYVAACLLRSDSPPDHIIAIRIIQDVLNAIDARGRLYSTLDSCAAIAMMVEMRSFGLGDDANSILVNGQLIAISDIDSANGNVRTVEAIGKRTLVQLWRIEHESWEGFDNTVPIQITLEQDERPRREFGVATKLDLVVKLTEGYEFGDVLNICLPDSLSWLHGGAQVKQFTIDFADKDTISVPLATTGKSFNAKGDAAPHHFAICVRNMYDEQRIGNPGMLKVNVR